MNCELLHNKLVNLKLSLSGEDTRHGSYLWAVSTPPTTKKRSDNF